MYTYNATGYGTIRFNETFCNTIRSNAARYNLIRNDTKQYDAIWNAKEQSNTKRRDMQRPHKIRSDTAICIAMGAIRCVMARHGA